MLNTMQMQAVQATEGPLLILAGAGSGKTTVLVNRVAYIIEAGLAKPWNILAITFTNKAANELKSRINEMLDSDNNDVWASTFHSMCLLMLRRDIDKLGYSKDFNIYDRADQLTLIKRGMKELSIDDKHFTAKILLNEIGTAKDNLKTVSDYEKDAGSDFRRLQIAKVYRYYQDKLKNYNALDFDDMIMLTISLFEKFPDVLEHYQDKFKYILVDEYQDTNRAQYILTHLLAKKHQNICVVGDDDQSIYRFRGADIENILNFEDDYKNVTVIKLEQNYRSTQNILNAANCVIKNNCERKFKKLWTDNDEGERIAVHKVETEYDEGRFIAQKIAEFSTSYNNFAILYRMNAQSRVIEEKLLSAGIPYRVVGGLRFYDRKEIKDLTAYLRLLHNLEDNVALMRVINVPKRGIGKTTVDAVYDIAVREGVSMFDIVSRASNFDELSRASNKLESFANMIKELQGENTDDLAEFVKIVLKKTGYLPDLEKEKSIENETRIENLNEFISLVKNYREEDTTPTLGEFLERIALYSDIDNYDEDGDAVVLMTLHSSKGLEFPIVFMPGMEEGVFPSYQSQFEPGGIEEERRLCYVGITRARKQLFMTSASTRTFQGKTFCSGQSRFVSELPQDIITISDETQSQSVATTWKNVIKPSIEAAPPQVDFNFKEGERVRHKKFGSGIIISLQSIGSDYKVEIAFDDYGTKNLMAAYAGLESA